MVRSRHAVRWLQGERFGSRARRRGFRGVPRNQVDRSPRLTRETTSGRIILIGAPGSGKGTQGRALAERLGVPHISTGEVLRELARSDTEIGREIASTVARGDLVPDDLIIDVLKDLFADHPRDRGYVLEGFPRTAAQAQVVDALLAPDAVVHLDVPDDVARARLGGRADAGRTDDAEQTVVDWRLRRFRDEVGAILRYYRDRGILVDVDATQTPELVLAAILRTLSERGLLPRQ